MYTIYILYNIYYIHYIYTTHISFNIYSLSLYIYIKWYLVGLRNFDPSPQCPGWILQGLLNGAGQGEACWGGARKPGGAEPCWCPHGVLIGRHCPDQLESSEEFQMFLKGWPKKLWLTIANNAESWLRMVDIGSYGLIMLKNGSYWLIMLNYGW